MLTIVSKKYEIEEEVQGVNEQNEVIYSFKMQITPEELKQINEIIINEESINLVKKMEKATDEEKEEIEVKLTEIAKVNQDMFTGICFKEHEQPFKDAMGEYKYLEMVELLFDFFAKPLLEKYGQRINTMNSYLAKK